MHPYIGSQLARERQREMLARAKQRNCRPLSTALRLRTRPGP
jgi:hypothetical protein